MRSMMWIRLVALLGAVVLALVAPAQAGTMYAIRVSGAVLVSIDTDTLEFTDIGPTGVDFAFGGMAWDNSTSTLYMIGGRRSPSLYEVNIETGEATLVGDHDVRDLFGLAYDSKNDVLYGVPFVAGQPLYTLDRSNGSAEAGPSLARRLGGLAYNSRDDDLIGIEDGLGDLFSIDRNSGELTLLFNGDFTNDSGLAYDPDKHLLWDVDYSGNLFSYDIANGYARTTHKTGLGQHDGLAFAGAAGAKCKYTIKKSKAKGGCESCPARGEGFESQARCEVKKDCQKKVKTTINCPQGNGTCKLKAKKRRCG